MSDAMTMQEALSKTLTKQIHGFKALVSCDQLTAGASLETYRIQVDTHEGERCYALRRSQPALTGESVRGQVGLETESMLLQRAANAGIPVPNVVYLLKPEDGLGEGYLMAWLEGETLGHRIVRSEKFAEVRPLLARQCGEALANIHAIEVDKELSQRLPTLSPKELVEEHWAMYQTLNVPEPMIDYTARWLLQNLPTGSRTTLVHGDFRNGNLMIDERGICAVLDWELAQIGDPMRDLGWLCVNSWRFGQADQAVGGFGSIENLLDAYQSASGIEVSRADLTFWQVFGSFWWSIATLSMSATWRTGETPSLERPVIGRRSSEAQMDCVNLIIPGSFELPAQKALDEGSQLPMPGELLESVRTFLKNDVAQSQRGQPAFLAKVAANALGIVQRELLYGPKLASDEHTRLQTLLGHGELDKLRWQLVEQLRGELPLDTPELNEHLRQTVAGQLLIDQPHYTALHALAT